MECPWVSNVAILDRVKALRSLTPYFHYLSTPSCVLHVKKKMVLVKAGIVCSDGVPLSLYILPSPRLFL